MEFIDRFRGAVTGRGTQPSSSTPEPAAPAAEVKAPVEESISEVMEESVSAGVMNSRGAVTGRGTQPSSSTPEPAAPAAEVKAPVEESISEVMEESVSAGVMNSRGAATGRGTQPSSSTSEPAAPAAEVKAPVEETVTEVMEESVSAGVMNSRGAATGRGTQPSSSTPAPAAPTAEVKAPVEESISEVMEESVSAGVMNSRGAATGRGTQPSFSTSEPAAPAAEVKAPVEAPEAAEVHEEETVTEVMEESVSAGVMNSRGAATGRGTQPSSSTPAPAAPAAEVKAPVEAPEAAEVHEEETVTEVMEESVSAGVMNSRGAATGRGTQPSSSTSEPAAPAAEVKAPVEAPEAVEVHEEETVETDAVEAPEAVEVHEEETVETDAVEAPEAAEVHEEETVTEVMEESVSAGVMNSRGAVSGRGTQPSSSTPDPAAPAAEVKAPVEAPEAAEAHEAEAGEAKSHDFENNSFRFDEDEFESKDKFDFGTGVDGLSIDATTVLKQAFSFDDADLSMLFDKCLRGDVRIIAEGDTTTPFSRNIPVNNYPGPGHLSQGTTKDAVAQSGEDNIPAPVLGYKEYIQVLSPDGIPFPNSRQLSNTLGNQGDSFTPEEAGFNNLFMGTGQYVDHGLDLIPKSDDPEAGGGDMTVFLPDNDPLKGKSFDFRGKPVNKLNLLPRALPTEGADTKVGEAEYSNSKTPFADQDQTYGPNQEIAKLLREVDQNGNPTARVLDNKNSRLSGIEVINGSYKNNGITASEHGVASIYDVVVNLADDINDYGVVKNSAGATVEYQLTQDQLKTIVERELNNDKWTEADQVLRDWDAKVRAQEFSSSVTGNPTMDSIDVDGQPYSVKKAIGILQVAKEKLARVDLGEGLTLDLNSLVGSAFNKLVGDANALARYSPYSQLTHVVSGDPRTNENVQLIAISNVFSANHNVLVEQVEASLARVLDQYPDVDAAPTGLENIVRLAQAQALAQEQPEITSFKIPNTGLEGMDGENAEGMIEVDLAQAIFEIARTVNNAAYQRMIYDQYVVHLAGGIHFGYSNEQAKELMPDTDKLLPQDIDMNEHGYGGVVPEVSPNVGLSFAGSAFRVGHSQIYPDLNGIKAELSDELLEFGDTIQRSLIQSFIQPTAVAKMGGAAGILAANAHDRAMAIDTYVVDEVRNMLVGTPNDLLAFNSERQYDMGLATLNETRQSLYDLFKDTGVANAKDAAASDASAGVFESGKDHNELAERLKPYSTWGDFKKNLRDESQIELFMDQFGGSKAALDNDFGLNSVPLYIGGLAEKQTDTPTGEGREKSLMGEVFTFLITTAFDEFQDPDEEYYKISIPGSDVLKQLGHQTWTPMIQTALGIEAQAIHQDTFRVARTDALAEGEKDFTAPEEHDFDGRAFNRIIYGNAEDNTLIGSEGKSSESASSENYASDDIRAGAGDDYVDAKSGEDWVYGQDGNDTLKGGDDHDIDHLFGGEGADKLYGNEADALFGEEGDDVLVRQKGTGFHDGGQGDDIILAGDSIDVVQGDSGEDDDENSAGDDLLFGGKGSDEVAGEGGNDLVVGGGSGSMSEDKIGDRLYGDAVAATHNAELLARAYKAGNGSITDTIVPLKSELGYGVVVGGVDPLTGKLFSTKELSVFKDYIESLRKVEDIDDPAGRGPRPTMVVMPYAGPTGDDTIYTGRHADILSELGERVDADELLSWMQRNGYAEEPAEAEAEAEVHVEGEVAAEAGAEVEAEAEAGAEVEAEAEAGAEVEAEPEDSRKSTDLVFADGGDDTIITDGENSTYVFGGQGYDTLISDLDSYKDLPTKEESEESSSSMSIYVDSLNEYGADGVVSRIGVERSDSKDHFFSMEHVVLDDETGDSSSNTLSVNDDSEPVSVDFRESRHGETVVVSLTDNPDAKGLEVSNVDRFDLSHEVGEQANSATLKLAGKLDYDGEIDSNKSDDNYKISWDGDSLKVNSRTTGKVELEGIQTVEFYHPELEAPTQSFYYKEFAEKALDLGLTLIKDGEEVDQVVLSQWGTEAERDGKYYVALTGESLRDSSISALDFTIGLNKSFGEVFKLNSDDIQFTDDLKLQRRLLITNDETTGTQSIRFSGAGLEGLGEGSGVSSKQVLAYVGLDLQDNIKEVIKQGESVDDYGRTLDNFHVDLKASVDANVDSVVWSDQYSLRDLGGQYALINPELEVVARSAEAKLTATGGFDLGTKRETTKSGDVEYTNLVRSGDTITQTNTWENEGEFTLVNLKLDSTGNDIAEVTAKFTDGSEKLSELGWSSEDQSVVEVTTSFTATGDAGQVIDTSQIGYKVSAQGYELGDTTKLEAFQVKHLVTYQGDLNYDGLVSMKDLVALDAGIRRGSYSRDVDANFDGELNMEDLSIFDNEMGESLHNSDGTFTGSNKISMEDIFNQGDRSWDSSNFAYQNSIESGKFQDAANADGVKHELDFTPELTGEGSVPGLYDSDSSLHEDQMENVSDLA